MNAEELTRKDILWRYKVEKVFGWGILVLVGISLFLLPFLSFSEGSPTLLRALIWIPFGIWYGVHSLNKAKKYKEILKQ